MIHLTSSDGTVFPIDREVAEKSVFIKDMLGDVGEREVPIPLDNITGPILERILNWCTHHRADPAPSPDQDTRQRNSDDIDAWDTEFCNVDQGTLFEMMCAANYLNIKPLLDLTCKSVANMIKGKTTEEIRTHFNIVNDFTPEEEEQVRRENEWCDER